jgi:hypothetical protein
LIPRVQTSTRQQPARARELARKRRRKTARLRGAAQPEHDDIKPRGKSSKYLRDDRQRLRRRFATDPEQQTAEHTEEKKSPASASKYQPRRQSAIKSCALDSSYIKHGLGQIHAPSSTHGVAFTGGTISAPCAFSGSSTEVGDIQLIIRLSYNIKARSGEKSSSSPKRELSLSAITATGRLYLPINSARAPENRRNSRGFRDSKARR